MEQIQSCGYSYALSNLIMDCVHKDPLHRPSHARFLQQILAIRAATRPSPSSPSVKWFHMHNRVDYSKHVLKQEERSLLQQAQNPRSD
jgi:hypothetical protein